MTKHRKILEGVSEGPLHAKPCVQPDKCCVVYSPQKMYHIANFDDKADANLFVYARNQWPAICDLIEAAEYFTVQWSEKPLLSGDIIGAVNKVKLALGKLNED